MNEGLIVLDACEQGAEAVKASELHMLDIPSADPQAMPWVVDRLARNIGCQLL
jgi:hypothetical protein